MPKFRKKPVVVEAIQVTCEMRQNFGPFPRWALSHLSGICTEKLTNSQQLFVRTPGGEMRVTDGDFLIRGVQGEVYPCKPDIFEATYELVE